MLQLAVGRKQETTRKAARRGKKKRPPNAVAVAVREFAAELGLDFGALSDEQRGEVFERFAAFHVLRRFHDQELEPLKVGSLVTSREGEGALHCMVMMVNGRIVEDSAALDAVLEVAAEQMAVSFAAVQATRANRFEPEKMVRFVDEVAAFFEGDAVDAALAPKRALLAQLRARAFESKIALRVSVYGYFAALGHWNDESGAAEALREGRRRVGSVKWLAQSGDGGADVEFEAVDRGRLLDFMATGMPLHTVPEPGKTRLEVEDYEVALPSNGLIAIPNIKGVEGGFFGHVPIGQFLQLLEREDGQGMREAIFNQNVRGYQGDGGVNARIRDTLLSKDRAQFLLRNNGVTVVADAVEENGGAVHLRNFQIVNGLQTSTVIYRNRDELRNARDVHVPVKLVGAINTPVRRAIIDATNRQTPITGAALFAACEKALAIEEHFISRARAGGPALVLERRPGQYAKSMPAERISLEELLRSFYAVFLEKSHVAERGFAALAGEVDDHLLAPSLTAEPYYVAARLLQFVREVARERDEARLAQIELHAALGLRLLCAPAKPPLGDSAAMRAMCRRIEMQMNAEGRRELLAQKVMDITQSPRDRMRSRVQGVPQLKKTRDAVVKRAMEEALPDPD
ncbi:MAG: AIPR family protein [Neomegalonema sp.]|nr:AIPR family protein [Neomegalonema sp.]